MKIVSRHITFSALLGLLLFLATGSCVKEEFSTGKLDTSLQIEPALATPLGFFSFKLNEDLAFNDDTRLSINMENLLCLKYEGKLVSDPAGSFFRFEQISEQISSPHPIGYPVNLSSEAYYINFTVKAPVFISNTGLQAKIDQVNIAHGFISFSDIRFPPVAGEAEITIEGLKSNDQAFQTKLISGMDNYLLDISGYSLDLSHGARNNLAEIDVYVSFPWQENILTGNETLFEVRLELEIIEWSEITGYLGEETFPIGQSTFNVELDDIFLEGNVYFAEPTLKIKTLNSFSVPFGLSLSKLSTISRESGTLSINGPGVPVAPGYFRPGYPNRSDLPGEKPDSLIIHSGNSNLDDVISSNPRTISYQVDLTTNPGDMKLPNVVHADSRFTTMLELELPFHGSANNVLLKDTLKTDLSRIVLPEDEVIQKLTFNLYYENSIPAEIEIQIYLVDQNFVVTEKLSETFARINAAPISNKYSDKPPFVAGQLEASFPGSRLERIMDTRFIVIEAVINTNEVSDLVKIFKNQGFDVNLGVIFEIETNIANL